MCTSPKDQKSWKKEFVQRWENLVLLYRKAKNSPSIKRWGKVMLEISKILLSVLIKRGSEKFFEHWFKDF